MSKSLDRLSLLQTFIRIADAGSISAAARSMGLSQPSVSRQLSELESRFKAQLMRRTTHTLSLTEAGVELLVDARRILDDWEALEEKHLESQDGLRGTLKVVVPIALGQLYLLDTVLHFQQQHPALALSWQLEDQPIRFAEVGCDCWVKIGAIADPSLTVEPLGNAERLVVATPELLKTYGTLQTSTNLASPDLTSPNLAPTDLAPTDLEPFPCVALAPFEGHQLPLTHTNGETVTVGPRVRMTTNNIFALHNAALAGMGIAVLPRWLIEHDLHQQTLVDVLPQWRAPTLTIHVASLPGRYRPRRLQRFLEILRVAVPAIPGIAPPSTRLKPSP